MSPHDIFGEKNDKVSLHIRGAVIEESDEKTMLRIKQDRKLKFKLTCSRSAKSRNCMRYPVFLFSWNRKDDETDDEHFCNVTVQLFYTDLDVLR